MSIKKVNQILKLKCYESSYNFVNYDSGWTLANCSLNADLYYSDRLHLVEKGNLKLTESIFNSIEVSSDFICRNRDNKFTKSYKMAVAFKLNNTDFPPLPFPSASKPVLSMSASLPFITACKPFPRNINIRSFAIAINTPISSVSRILEDNYFPKFILNPSKSPISNLACNIPVKHNQRSNCKSVQSFQPVAINVNVVSVHVRHRLHVVKSVFFCHQHVSYLAKPIFLTVDTATDTLNVCNVVKYVSSTHNVRKVFRSTHNSISIPRQVYCPENDNNIANSHLPLTNLLSSSETKSSTSSLTLNLNFSEWTFSLPEISYSRIYHHVSSSVKFSLFFMILFNAMLLHQPLQRVLIFNILTDFTLFLLVCLKFYDKTCGTMTFYIKQHQNLLCFLFDSFLTCNVLKITGGIPMEDFSLNFKVFTLVTTCLVFCLKNKTFVVTVQKFCPKGSYWIKPCENLSFLVHFILFVICITFLLVKILLSTVLKTANFIVSLFCTIFKYRIIITFLFLTFEHERLFKNHLSVNRSFTKISYQNNIFNNRFNNFNAFLANLNSFGDFKICSKVICHVEATHLTLSESQLSGFSMMRVFTERCLRC